MKTLLVLEDESAIMQLLRHELNQYRLLEAATAEQAVRLFFSHRREIDLLIADITLPISSGIRVAMLLRAEVPELPVVLTSGYDSSDLSIRDTADLDKLGSESVAVLQKPFRYLELSNTVRRLIGGVTASAT